jgi:hypothetical protein
MEKKDPSVMTPEELTGLLLNNIQALVKGGITPKEANRRRRPCRKRIRQLEGRDEK